MRFEFATATRIVFGAGTVREVAPEAARLGRRPLVVTGGSPGRADPLVEALRANGLAPATFAVPGEPTVALVAEGVRQARAAGCDVVVGFGGGSALDAAKAVAAMLTNPGDLYDYLEVVGRGQPLPARPAPVVAVPTTAGTGAEVTRNAVLASPAHRVKVSLRSPLMLPVLAVVDPALAASMPFAVAASTGLDALTQVMEPFVSHRANALTDGLCREGMARAARSLVRACEEGADAAAREDMALASLFGGLALANAALGAVHGFAGPIGGRWAAPHGIVCARLLPFVMEANVRALQARAPGAEALARYDEVGRLLTGRPAATAADAVAWVHAVSARLRVPPLSAFGLTAADVPAVVEQAKQASSMKGNPISLTDAALADVLTQAMG
jgi:alcohol dehydrogenase class IV